VSTTADVTAVPERWVVPGLCLGSFVAALTSNAPSPFLADMARDLDTTVPVLGQVTAAMLLLSAGLGLVLGPLADRYGHRRLILLGLVAAIATQVVYGVAPLFQVLFLASLWGAFAAATVPALSLAIASTHFSGQAARRAVGWTVAGLAGSAIVGVPILTTIGGVANWRTAFLAASIMTMVVLLLVANWLPPDQQQDQSSLRLRGFLSVYRPLLSDRTMARLYTCCVLRSVCWFGLLTYVGAFLDEQLGFSTPEIGFVYMLGGSGYFLGSLAAAGPLTHIPPLPLLAVGNGVMGVLTGCVLAASFGTTITVAMFPVLGFAGAVGWVGLVGLLAEKTPIGSGTTMVLNGSLLNLGAFGGGAAGGALIALGGYTGLAIGLPGFGLLSAIVAWPPRQR
jgi:MFS transporter, DHA1 family, inner membrane transport protein